MVRHSPTQICWILRRTLADFAGLFKLVVDWKKSAGSAELWRALADILSPPKSGGVCRTVVDHGGLGRTPPKLKFIPIFTNFEDVSDFSLAKLKQDSFVVSVCVGH